MSQGFVYNIQRMSVQDGPGLRTTVFLKGCPLHCLWCSNPESQAPTPQLMFFEDLCVGCGRCQEVCPRGAVVPAGTKFSWDVNACVNCGACAEVCPSKARVISGSLMTVNEVMQAVRKDELFYLNSGGGVTFGGGEPTAAGEFFLDLVRATHQAGYHVCVDTCGACPEERFARIVELADFFLFDCKHMDPAKHKELTGLNNTVILKNLRLALSSKAEVQIRMPLMPGLNDSVENITALADFLREYDRYEVEIMPYHCFGRSKYLALGRPVPQVAQYSPEDLRTVLARFESYGLHPVLV